MATLYLTADSSASVTPRLGFIVSYIHLLLLVARLQHPDVFQLIHKHNLFDSISDKIVQLMKFNQDRTVKMLVDNTDKVPVCKHEVPVCNHEVPVCKHEVWYVNMKCGM